MVGVNLKVLTLPRSGLVTLKRNKYLSHYMWIVVFITTKTLTLGGVGGDKCGRSLQVTIRQVHSSEPVGDSISFGFSEGFFGFSLSHGIEWK